MQLRHHALQILAMQNPNAKAAATKDLYASWNTHPSTVVIEENAPCADGLALPGTPERPVLLAHNQVARRSPATPHGRAVLMHSIAHIELNAINLALDAIWRFNGMPPAYYTDWLMVAAEEALHFGLLRDHLQAQGYDYGDFPAHQGLWTMCDKTAHDVTARMALVPRTLEARGLDATPLIQNKLRQVATPDAFNAASILDTILRDEVGHVAIGNHWYRWLCLQQGLDAHSHYLALTEQYDAPRLRPPFNTEARRTAGFTEQEIAWLQQH